MLPSGVIASVSGLVASAIDGPALFVAVLIGVSDLELKLHTYTALPFGVIAIASALPPTGMAVRAAALVRACAV